MNPHESFTIFVADLPVNEDSNQPYCLIDEYFLRQLFQGVSMSPYAVVIQTKIGCNGKPYAYALIQFDTHEQAMEAIEYFNYTKLNNIPIRLYMADYETNSIIKNGQGKILIKNLDPEIEVSQLHDAFANFGEVITCEIPSDLVIRGDERKYVSRGYGYVQFRNPEDAKQAIVDLKDASINGSPIEIQHFDIQQDLNPEQSFTYCYINDLPERFTDGNLKDLFSEYGTPVTFKVIFDINGQSKQFGFCSMSTHEEAVRAVEALNGRVIDGMPLHCGIVTSKSERENYEKNKGRNLYIQNFDETVTEEELKEIFSKFGEIENLKIMKDKNGNSRKFGFVCFKTPEQAKECIQKSSLILIHNKQIYVFLN